VRAQDERGQPVDFKTMDRKAIGKTHYRVEATTITTPQRIQIRKLMQALSIAAKPNEELASVPVFLERLRVLIEQAGGEAPQPARPDAGFLDDLRRSLGNEQLLALYNQRETLEADIRDWQARAETIQARWKPWTRLKQLAQHAAALEHTAALRAQVQAIEDSRQLLAEPDPVPTLSQALAQALREQLKQADTAYAAQHAAGLALLKSEPHWAALEPEQRNQLLAAQKLTLADAPQIKLQSVDDVLDSLQAYPLLGLADRVAAMPGRFAQILEDAALLCEPKVQFVELGKPTLQTAAEVDAWAAEAAEKLKAALARGPVRPR
jgi:hypothetical protein